MPFDFISLTSMGASIIAICTGAAWFLARTLTERQFHEIDAPHKLTRDHKRQVSPRPAQPEGEPGSSTDATVDKASGLLADLSTRLENLEDRFPEDATLDKLASVNDAILATRLDELSRRIDRLEIPTMTNGDVMKIVLGFISALAAVVAVSTWVLGQLAT